METGNAFQPETLAEYGSPVCGVKDSQKERCINKRGAAAF
jgi:hypothetical protein